jgi:protein-L-isoaspartate(D-aspartate) O-methyltransferase
MDMNIEQARFNMIEQQIRPWDVLDQQVLDLLIRIPREEFVPSHLRALAFTDTALPLGKGVKMMEPKLEGRLLQALAIQPTDKALEIGSGSGYLTALLAGLARKVVSVEIDEALHSAAKARLEQHQINNVNLHLGDAANGWNAERPYDVIAVTGSVASIPQGLKDNMEVGGRMFIVVGKAPPMQAILVQRLSFNEWRETVLFETSLPPLQGLAQEEKFVF